MIPVPGVSPREMRTRVHRKLVHKCSQNLSLYQPKSANPNVHQMMSEQIKCGISIQWNVVQPQQGMTQAATGTNLASIMLSERSQSQKAIFYDPTYMKFSEEANQRQKADRCLSVAGVGAGRDVDGDC